VDRHLERFHGCDTLLRIFIVTDCHPTGASCSRREGEAKWRDLLFRAGYTNPGTALEQVALLRRRIFTITEKILRHGDGLGQREKVLPGLWPPGQNDVPGNLIAADVNLRTFKPQVSGQADGLAASVAKEFGDPRHGIYYDIFHCIVKLVQGGTDDRASHVATSKDLGHRWRSEVSR
jgi:hypothetical protein